MREYLVPGNTGRFLGFWSVFIQAAFAYGGPDMIAMTAGEARYPRRVLPNVFNRVIFRLLFFYIGGTFCIGTLVSRAWRNWQWTRGVP
jgi:amino acid transporter